MAPGQARFVAALILVGAALPVSAQSEAPVELAPTSTAAEGSVQEVETLRAQVAGLLSRYEDQLLDVEDALFDTQDDAQLRAMRDNLAADIDSLRNIMQELEDFDAAATSEPAGD